MLLHMQGLAWIFHILTHGFVQAGHEDVFHIRRIDYLHTSSTYNSSYSTHANGANFRKSVR